MAILGLLVLLWMWHFFNEDKAKQNKARIILSWTEDLRTLVGVGVGIEGWNDEMKSFGAKFSFPCSPPPPFKMTVLLGYNSHTIKYTPFRCTTQGFLEHSQSCATSTNI